MYEGPRPMIYINIITLNILNNYFVHTNCPPDTAQSKGSDSARPGLTEPPLFILSSLAAILQAQPLQTYAH